jgi:hypothetical protein
LGEKISAIISALMRKVADESYAAGVEEGKKSVEEEQEKKDAP